MFYRKFKFFDYYSYHKFTFNVIYISIYYSILCLILMTELTSKKDRNKANVEMGDTDTI